MKRKLHPNFLRSLYCFLAILAFFISSSSGLYAQTGEKISVSGTVTDVNDEPLIGVSVIEQGTPNATVTDLDGKYTLNVSPNSTLKFSFLSFKTEEKKVNNKRSIDIILHEDTKLLDEVVVVGYGTMDKKELTSAISHISSKDFLSVSSVDPSMMIQGKVSGVSITNTGVADPNNQASIQIRGISSRSAGLGPLIVIDGVPGGNLTNVNPNDIASIDVLKDGAASAIYGTRGSNGVILVTTKKGNKDGKRHTSYSGMFAANVMMDELRMLNASEYRAIRSDGTQGVDLGGDTDWIDEISRIGTSQQHTITLSGGDVNSNYRISADYKDAKGIDLRSRRQEYGARASLNHTTQGGLLTFSANIAPRIAYRDASSWDSFKSAIEVNPTTTVIDLDDPSKYTNFLGQSAAFNPVELLKLEQDKGETKLLDWDATVKLNLFPLLLKDNTTDQLLTTQLTFADQQSDNFDGWFRPSTSTLAQNGGYSGEASRRYSKYRQHSLEWLANYQATFKDHRIKGMLGYSYQYFQSSGMNAENKDFPSDGLGFNNLGQGEWAKEEEGRLGMGSYKNDSKLIAFFGRISYDYKEKYLFTASLRHEGSSKFGVKHKWGNFPAVSAGWRISSESFMKDIKWINDLKFRMDYGETGNQDFASYLSLNTMTGFGSYYYNGKYFTVWGPAKNVNPYLKWEKGKNYNIGMDFSLLNNKLSGSLNYYYRKQQDLLGDYNVPIPPYLFSTTFVNVGTLQNSGFELDIQWDAIKTKDFSYSLNLVGSTISNKFLDFSNSEYVGEDYYNVCNTEDPLPFNYLQRIQKGERLGNFYMWKYAGIDENGSWIVYDKNDELIRINEATEEDKRIVGNGLPKFTGSMTHNFNYKNWNLSIFFRGAFGYDIYNIHDLYYGVQSMQGNVLKKAYTKNVKVKGETAVTDYFLESGDYLKLDMISLGYTFDANNKYINKARVYVTGKNLATFSKFSGVDPATYQTNGLTPGATSSRSYYPSTRQFIVGVQFDF